MFESHFFCIFQELMNKGKYAHVGLFVKHALGKCSCVHFIEFFVVETKRFVGISVNVILTR